MNKKLNGHNWEVTELGDGVYSVVCLDPDISSNSFPPLDGIDYTRWPKDSEVSEWVGKKVRFGDAGDHPDHPEGIYYQETEETED